MRNCVKRRGKVYKLTHAKYVVVALAMLDDEENEDEF